MTNFCVFSVKFSFFGNLSERLIVLTLRGVVAFETLILGVSCFETLAGRGFAGCFENLIFERFLGSNQNTADRAVVTFAGCRAIREVESTRLVKINPVLARGCGMFRKTPGFLPETKM